MAGFSDDDPTIGPSGATVTRPTAPGDPRAPAAGRFTPGSIIAGRYRLVALLGRGGMGEVYRADDLTLDQPVALKFLPQGVGDDAVRLTQFHNELRLARQVSHKNVCRLYDVGEADGRRFLTMEYVDGEDLASLLRRIGRFPQDRAIDVARQLCAGISAAHERGIVHRDLKPANVMIDGDGNVRITDFGIATAASDAGGVVAGTPQYMAPEQLAGRPASTAADIYALGLILFEIFTGKRAHEAATLADLRALHDTGTVTTPSSIVHDLDPAIERAILRCLETDPARRPPSALTVAVSLPGGNPVAAALAAGETPSPEMLIAAGQTDAVPVGRAVALLAPALLALGIYAVASPRATIAALVPLDRPPAVLADRAAQIAASVGYTDTPADETYNFALPGDYPRWLAATDPSPRRWDALASGMPPAMVLWYRSSPGMLAPVRTTTDVTLVSPTDPAPSESGMRTVIVDTGGRLVEFHAVPNQRDPDHTPAPPPRWGTLFEAAGLPMPSFTPVEPEWTPREYADTRAAWEGPLPDRPDVRIRVEAAAYRGRPVSFLVVGPWTRASRMQLAPQSRLAAVLSSFALVFWLTALLASALVARHHLKTNRADRRSASRLAIAFIVLQLLGWLIGNHHVPSVNDEVMTLFKTLSSGALNGGFIWVLYLALEPFVRRLWPDGLLGWTRLLSGRLRDPRVGRDLVIGIAYGAALLMVDLLHQFGPRAAGRAPVVTQLGTSVKSLVSTGWIALTWMQQIYDSVQSALLIVLVFVALRMIVRRTWIAVAIGIAIVVVLSNNTVAAGGVIWMDPLFGAAAIGLLAAAIFRHGLLAAATMLVFDNVASSIPFTGRVFHWSAAAGNMTLLLLLGLAAFAFYAAAGVGFTPTGLRANGASGSAPAVPF